MKYAVIRIKGAQYKVEEGQEILVDKLSQKKIEPEVLLFSDGKSVKIGKPTLKDVKVTLKVVGDEKGEKLLIQTYKAKSRHRRRLGYRHSYTRLQVQKIS